MLRSPAIFPSNTNTKLTSNLASSTNLGKQVRHRRTCFPTFGFIAVRKLLQHMGGAARRAAPPMCCT